MLCACVGAERIELAGKVLDALHQRRPELPLVALSLGQDADLELVVRAADAAVYLPLVGQTDDVLLRDTVASLTRISPRGHPPNHTGLSPPSIRAGQPVHTRFTLDHLHK